jgi:hypothetical protein
VSLKINDMHILQTRRLLPLILIFYFSALTAFTPVLHAHEWDGEPVHKDCAPCHFNQHFPNIEVQAPILPSPPRIERVVPAGNVFRAIPRTHTCSSRSPPQNS